MDQDWLTVVAYFAEPGLERTLKEVGVQARARIDPGADITCVSSEIVEEVYGGLDRTPRTALAVLSMSELRNQVTSVPLLVGVTGPDGAMIHAQVDCVVLTAGTDVLIGNNFLSLLGLQLKI